MQRRNGKQPAHITITHTGDGDEHDSEKSSPLNQKTLGLTHRIWIILAVFGVVVVITRTVNQHDYSLPRHGLTNSKLRPKNYLNATNTDTEPFAFCPVFGPGDEIGMKHGIHALTKSRLHLGSGARIQKVIHKALAGMPVTISVLGGSVSACHGAGDDPISPKCYPARFFDWWNSVFPHPASELTNGAMRRTNSAYFSFCNAHHLPDLTDLVILEFDVDDPNEPAWLEHFELLVRSILLRPDQPAIIILGHFSPQVQQAHGYHGPESMHSVVAQFYDVPHISVKPSLYPVWVSNPEAISSYFTDPVLANPTGHELMSEMLIAYIQSQVCAAWSAATGRAYDVVSPFVAEHNPVKQGTGKKLIFGGVGGREGGLAPPEPPKPGAPAGVAAGDSGAYQHMHLPLARINSRPDTAKAFEEVQPFCVSANDLINPLPPSLFYGSGWHAHHPSTGMSAANSYEHYWYSTLPTSKLRVPLQVGAGDIGVYFLREPRADVDRVGSAVECWVDDNYPGARILSNAGDVDEPTPVLEMIDHHVSRGSHFVECKLMGEEGRGVPPFKLLGIFTT